METIKKINIEVLKQPIDLSNKELTKIYESTIDCSFDKWIIDELLINKDIYSQVPVVNISCKNTGYSLNIKGCYNVELSSSVGYKSRVNVFGLFKCLFEIEAIKIN